MSFGNPNWMIPVGEETLEPYIKISRRNYYQIMELRPLKLGIKVGNRGELGILTSFALKCRNLSLGDPNEMIPIPTKNRLIEIKFS